MIKSKIMIRLARFFKSKDQFSGSSMCFRSKYGSSAKNYQQILEDRIRPEPITFVRVVFMADVANGAAMYNIRARCLMVKLLKSMSSWALPLWALNPFSDLLCQLAPASP